MIATTDQLCKVFAMNANLDIPEKRLFFGVIAQAVADLKPPLYAKKAASRRNETDFAYRSAVDFFNSSALDNYCLAIDLESDWVRLELRKHAGLP